MSIVNSNNFLHKTVDGVKQFFSPLVNAATVVLKDGTRLEKDGKIHADTADDSDKLGGKAPDFYTPYTNLADNSDFEHWVAQAGIGGMHGAKTYGGDRWNLTSGTITGEANADGNGYSNITLNGTLVQHVFNGSFFDATVFVEMKSGTSTAVYHPDSREIVIVSAGGVIKNVLLLPGVRSEKPMYVAKRFATEWLNARRYFKRINISGLHSALGLFYYSSGEFALGAVFADIEMVQKSIPDAKVTFAGDLKLYGQNGTEHPVNAMTAVQSEGNILRIGISTSGLTPGIYALRGTGYIDVSCDL